MLLGGNWKRRSDSFFDDLIAIAKLYGKDELIPHIQSTLKFKKALFPENPKQSYTELSPRNLSQIFSTVDTSADAHQDDLKRFEGT
jgi:hypothetical protein